MMFSTKPVNVDDIQLEIGRNKLTKTTNYMFQGKNLENKLNFNCRINSIVTKVAKSNSILFRMRKFLSTEARIKFYYSIVYPYLSYNVSIWVTSHENTSNSLVSAKKEL